MKLPSPLQRGLDRLLHGWRRHPEGWLLATAATGLTLALLRPPLPVHEQLVHALLVVDITQSMNVPDGNWDSEALPRVEQARRAIAELLRDVPCGSRIGLGVFNEYRTFVLLAPLEVCDNFRELQATLDTIGNRMSWSGASEIAKGLNSGFQSVQELPDKPALVLFTDGQESPPISMKHRPKINVKPGEVGGVLVGTGSLRPQPIPKFDPSGNRIGFWQADEVAQVDIYSKGREGSVAGESYVEDPADQDKPKEPEAPKAKAGQEHLSSLREPYLQLLADETGLGYLHLTGHKQLQGALLANRAASSRLVGGDGRWVIGVLALLAVLSVHLGWRIWQTLPLTALRARFPALMLRAEGVQARLERWLRRQNVPPGA